MKTIWLKIWPLLKIVFQSVFLIYLGLGMALFFFQRSFIYFPDKTDFLDCSAFSTAKKVVFGSTNAYFTERSKDKLIIYYHGNGGRACDRSFLDQFFATKAYSTLFVEYSGYSETARTPSMSSILENVSDTINFVQYKSFKEVVIIGESIGSGPAAYHASLQKTSLLILITPYTNLVDIAIAHYPIYPMNLLLRDNFTPDKWLADYKEPVTIIIAENDEIIPRVISEKLFDGLISHSKNKYVVKDAGHNTIYDMEEFFALLRKVL